MTDKKDMAVKAGDQSMKLKNKGMKQYQGDKVADAKMFPELAGKEGALRRDPKIKSKPSAGTPGDVVNKGKAHSMPKAKEDVLMPMRRRSKK